MRFRGFGGPADHNARNARAMRHVSWLGCKPCIGLTTVSRWHQRAPPIQQSATNEIFEGVQQDRSVVSQPCRAQGSRCKTDRDLSRYSSFLIALRRLTHRVRKRDAAMQGSGTVVVDSVQGV